MIRELRHFFTVLRGRVPFVPPLVDANGHVKHDGNSVEAALLRQGRRIRCPKCFLPMVRVPVLADTDHPIAKAAARYTEQGQQP